MTRTEILLTMHAKEPGSLFYTMQLGGSMAQLGKMECDGLIASQSRRRRGRQRDWYLTDEQHAELSFLFANPEISPTPEKPTKPLAHPQADAPAGRNASLTAGKGQSADTAGD